MYNVPELEYLTQFVQDTKGGMGVPPDRPPIIETAEVKRVDPTNWVVDLFSFVTSRPIRNVEIPGSGFDGSMMGYFPQPGDWCVVAHLSDVYSARILSFVPVPRQGLRNQRKAMQPGDMLMYTPAGNYVHVAAGGVVDIAAGPITRRLMVPLLNQIKDFCESYFLNSAGGQLRWENRRDDVKGPGSQCELIWDFKDITEGGTTASLRVGSVEGVNGMAMGLPGKVLWHQVIKDALLGVDLANVTFDNLGNLKVVATNVGIEAKQLLTLTAAGGLTILSPTAPLIFQSPSVILGYGGAPAVLGPPVQALLKSILEALGAFAKAGTGNPVVETALSAASTGLTAALESIKPQVDQILARNVLLS